MSCTKLFKYAFIFGKIKNIGEKTNYNLILQYGKTGIPYNKYDSNSKITRIYPFYYKQSCEEVITQIKQKTYCFKCADPSKCNQ
jgi:hypothetical protein